jgi:hypothetical protein
LGLTETQRTCAVVQRVEKEKCVSGGVLVVLLEAGVVVIIALAIYLIRKK